MGTMTKPTREQIIKELLHIAENSRSKGEVCRAAAEMLEKSRWISVEEKLPDYNDHSYHPIAHNCFCRDIHNNYGFAIFYTSSTDRSDLWITTDGGLDTVLITHWMPLPSFPDAP